MMRGRIMTVLLPAAVAAGLLASPAAAGTRLWSKSIETEIEWHRVTVLGTVLVGTADWLGAVKPDSGEFAWKRDDLKKVAEANVDEIWGTPLLVVGDNQGSLATKTRVVALDLANGQTLWQSDELRGVTVDVEPVYPKGYLLMATIPANAAKSKLDFTALDMVTGKVKWQAGMDEKVDLHISEASGRFVQKFDLSGHQPPVVVGNDLFFSYAGLHRYNADTGALAWKVEYDVTAGTIKRGNAQIIVDGDTVYTAAKGVLRAVDRGTGQLKWTSKDFGGAIAEMERDGEVLYGRLGGTFYDKVKKEFEQKKPFGVVAVDKKTGAMIWRYDDAKDSITNMVLLDDPATILVADAKNLIGLDRNAKGNAKEAFKVKLEFKEKLGAGDVAAGIAKFALGGLKGLSSGSGKEQDGPLAISQWGDGPLVVRGKQNLLAFEPKTRQIPWSVQYGAPGSSGLMKGVMFALSALSYAANTAVAANSYLGTAENTWANSGRQDAIKGYSDVASKRFSATQATDRYAYILTTVQEGEEKGPGLIGVRMDTGKSDRQLLLKDKEPKYKVDEVEGRAFVVTDKSTLTGYSLK
jgi:outer membrane protein assembly factor BamB